MKMLLVTALVGALGATAIACDNKPTEGKSQAQVGEAVSTTAAPSAAPAASAVAVVASAAASGAVVALPTVELAIPAGGEGLAITPDNSKIEFTGAKVTGKHEGKFQKFAGMLALVPATPEQSKVKVDIVLSSVKTDQEKLDGHLQSKDFFDVEKFTTATFESTSIKTGGDKGATHTITGNFNFHGVSKSLSFPATITVKADKVSAKAEFGINRKDFKLEYPGKADDLIKDDVLIKLDLELPRAKK